MNGKNEKSLLEVFKELKQNKDKQVEEYKQTRKKVDTIKVQEKKEKISFQIKQRTLKDNLKLIFIALAICVFVSISSSNYIFAKDSETEDVHPVGSFEENEDVLDVYEIVSENISTTYQKEVADVEEEIEFETEYVDDKDLPKGEEVVKQEGIKGSQIVTYVRSYENEELTGETAIGYSVTKEPTKKIIHVGTSEVLKNYNIHIGDSLYATKDLELKKEASDSARKSSYNS